MTLINFGEDLIGIFVMNELISVIVCHHKGETLITNAIKSIQHSQDVNYEIIVATSSDDYASKYQFTFKDVNFMTISGGPAYKRNVASRYARGNYYAFFDDDVEVTGLTLYWMLKTLKDRKAGMVYGKLLNMEFKDRFDEAGSFLTPTGFLWARCESGVVDAGQFDREEAILAGKSASCIVRRDIFLKVGGFDVSYGILGEETDLSWRIWLIGSSVWFSYRSVTYHAFNTKFKPADFYVPERVYRNGCRNYLSMLLTNLEKPNVFMVVLIQVIVWFTAGIGMMITGKFEAGSNIFKGLADIIINIRRIIHKRALVQSTRVISDKELFKTIKRNPPFSYYYKRFFHYIKTGRHG